MSARQEKKKKKKEKKKKPKGDVLSGGVEGEADSNAEAGPSIVPFQGTEEEKKQKVEEIMDEYYALDHEDMVRPHSVLCPLEQSPSFLIFLSLF